MYPNAAGRVNGGLGDGVARRGTWFSTRDPQRVRASAFSSAQFSLRRSVVKKL